MPEQNFLPVGLLKKQAHERWSHIYDQIDGVTKDEKKTALIEILALRELALTYLTPPEEIKPKQRAGGKQNKSFIR